MLAAVKRVVAALFVSLAVSLAVAAPSHARADEPAPPAAVTVSPERPAVAAEGATEEGAPPAAPPPKPYAKSLVLDTSLGALVPMGAFRHVAPPSPWMRLTVGYELFRWLMLFGSGELSLTDTSVAQGQPNTRAFPIFGFGGGARVTVRLGARFGLYGQGELGAMRADIADGALRLVGFGGAESLGLYAGGRLGFEWYQVDRHFALGTSLGVRDAFGFAHDRASDTPLMLDASLAVRYAF